MRNEIFVGTAKNVANGVELPEKPLWSFVIFLIEQIRIEWVFGLDRGWCPELSVIGVRQGRGRLRRRNRQNRFIRNLLNRLVFQPV